ncbi:MAG: acetyl-CoA carboxylase biotin carboxyl carrier protein [Candidatus Krumholzibacteria bacterium]|nr:acetyl-CoA carboxylase biotin carboxyl carrier protein [Candidatus Krumholzibacteria bacterium]MDH4337980.1 acetyl-CoA carboxylase biotin carboxyl carrier protein [Candidatus Krumholzibacteria bacterium]MDH5268899.1 acetyl-CoA carboxylase biotin carboxyl carrier protein [Candidatus Krumholzibacteria bacterium]
MRKQEIEELIRLVEESGINELEVSHGRKRIRISKGGSALFHGVAAGQPPAPAPHPSPQVAGSEDDAGEAGGEEKLASNLKQIKSPMVGTFYRAPAPGSEPFAEIGQTVAVGQTVCIVEAMKLMNEIGSDFNGVIRRVLTENGQPVEYGQPLFLIETK